MAGVPEKAARAGEDDEDSSVIPLWPQDWMWELTRLREKGIRAGSIKPRTPDERQQAAEGPRNDTDLDCVRTHP